MGRVSCEEDEKILKIHDGDDYTLIWTYLIPFTFEKEKEIHVYTHMHTNIMCHILHRHTYMCIRIHKIYALYGVCHV